MGGSDSLLSFTPKFITPKIDNVQQIDLYVIALNLNSSSPRAGDMCDDTQGPASLSLSANSFKFPLQSTGQASDTTRLNITPSDDTTPTDKATPTTSSNNEALTSSEYLKSRDCCDSLSRGVNPTRSPASPGCVRIQFTDLIMDLPNWISSGALQAEFKSLPKVFAFSKDTGKSETVAKKNRSREIVPYDHNRVILTTADLSLLHENERDYINASFLRSLPGKNGFIATQGPMLGSLEDFWGMVWAQNSRVVLMLCRLVENCQNQSYKFWPDVGECLDLDDVNLRSEEEETRSAYVLRKLSLRHIQTEETRAVTLLQFTAWPDTCLPCPAALLCLWRAYRRLQDTTLGPPVIMCSDGSSRCGLFIALDNVVSQWEETAAVDVVSCVVKAREDRMCMLDSLDQYTYLYTILAEVFLCRNLTRRGQGKVTESVENNFIDQDDQRKDNQNISSTDWDAIIQEYKLITLHRSRQKAHDSIFVFPNTGFDSRCTIDGSDRMCSAHRFLYPDVTQDFVITCLPLEQRSVQRPSVGRVYRLRHSISLQENKMMLGITGVLPSHCQSSFLICQSLSMSQGPDLWQLVFDTGCRTVVKLLADTGGTKSEAWPLYTEDFSIELASHLTLKEIVQETKLALRTNMEPWSPLDGEMSPETTIKMFTVPWSRDSNTCHMTPPADVLIFLYEILVRWLEQTKTTIIAMDCGNCTEAAVHFCACFNLLSTLQADREVDVGQVWRAVHCPFSGLISQEDYLHLYRLKDLFNCQRGNDGNQNNDRKY
ncbi:hypothetical protein RRG08_031839 [Elysia crispata]|uniref:Uncharacterized protein n=1 Tax=Elysia crispata TaxID=231223 RepID=A0AAE1CT69_9GAST|nr:hypothetical protein RRG08_031839 [Elysia crispata]